MSCRLIVTYRCAKCGAFHVLDNNDPHPGKCKAHDHDNPRKSCGGQIVRLAEIEDKRLSHVR